MFQSINEKLQDKNFLEQAIEMTTESKVATTSHSESKVSSSAKSDQVSSKAPGGMSDADVACYSGRYGDVTGDARQHYMNVGQAEGRNPNCAANITDYQAQKYIDRNPDLQYAFGRSGKFAKISSRQNYTDFGFDQKKNVKSEEWDTPWFCGDTPQHQCMCSGTFWRGAINDPLTGSRLETFDDMRLWASKSKEVNDWADCTGSEFGGDTYKGKNEQCWCEPKPQEVPTRCAEDGDDCLCNGLVYYTQKFVDGGSQLANFYDGVNNYWAVQTANNTKNVTCQPELFEDTDVLPGEEKQCFCDENKLNLDEDGVQYIKEYWRGVNAERNAKEAQVRAQAEAEAAAKAAEEEAARAAAQEKADAEEAAAAAARAAKEAAEAKARADAEAAERKAAEDAKKAAAKKKAAEEKAAAEAAAAAAKAAEEAAEAARLKAQAEKDAKVREKLLAEAQKAKEAAIKAAVEKKLAEEAQSHEEEMERLRAEQQAREIEREKQEALAAEEEAKAKALAEAEAEKARQEEEKARLASEAAEKSAEAERMQAAMEQAIADALEAQQKALAQKEEQEAKRREKEDKKRAEREAKELAQKQREEAKAAEIKRKADEKAAAEKAKAEALEKALKAAEDAEHAEQLRLDQEAHEKALAEQKAKDDLLKAQRAEEMAQSQEDIRAAQEAAAKAQKAFEDAEAERKAVAAHKKQLAEELAQKEAEAKNAEAAAKAAAQAQREAEASAAQWAKQAEAAKKKAAADMAKAEAEQKAHEAKLAAEKKANQAKHDAAVKAQQAAFKKAKAAAHAAALAQEESRKKKEAQAIADHKKEMAARRAKFEAKFRNVWATGPTGVSKFHMTFDTKSNADDLIAGLFAKTLIADVEKMQNTFVRTLSIDGTEKVRQDGVIRVTGVTSDDRVAELIEHVAEHDPNHIKTPAFDLVIIPLAAGSTEYLAWVKEQTLKKDDSAAFFNEKPKEAMKALDNAVGEIDLAHPDEFKGVQTKAKLTVKGKAVEEEDDEDDEEEDEK